jgi:hypothetical protein
MIGQGKGGHFQLQGFINKITDFASAVKKTIFTMDMEMDKIFVLHTGLSLMQVNKIQKME